MIMSGSFRFFIIYFTSFDVFGQQFVCFQVRVEFRFKQKQEWIIANRASGELERKFLLFCRIFRCFCCINLENVILFLESLY